MVDQKLGKSLFKDRIFYMQLEDDLIDEALRFVANIFVKREITTQALGYTEESFFEIVLKPLIPLIKYYKDLSYVAVYKNNIVGVRICIDLFPDKDFHLSPKDLLEVMLEQEKEKLIE